MIRNIRVAVCDDEKLSTTCLELSLKKYGKEAGENFEISTYADGQALINHFKNQFDIILLDILMPVMNGLETAEYIRKRDDKVIIIFITSVDRFLSEGYTWNIFNYIVKPVQYTKFKETISRAVSRMQEIPQAFIMIKNDNGLFKIYINEIRYIETYGRKLKIHRGNDEVLCYKKMKELEEILRPYDFFRCHSGYLVNLSYVLELAGSEAVLSSNDRIPVSQNRRRGMRNSLKGYAGQVL